jgi:hypothetical protein
MVSKTNVFIHLAKLYENFHTRVGVFAQKRLAIIAAILREFDTRTDHCYSTYHARVPKKRIARRIRKMRDWLSKFVHRKRRRFCASLVRTYREISSASVDELWQQVVDLADVSWHPLLKSTNVPYGLVPKPGLIYQAVTRISPIPIRIFVERVNPRELLSVRILAIPGVEERVTYRVESTVCGTCVSYSVKLRGWLSPLIWPFSRPYSDRVARALVDAVEKTALPGVSQKRKSLKDSCFDF